MKIKFLALSFGVVLAIPGAVHSASRSSANYSVPADTADAGGRKLTSAAYSIDSSVGCLGGVSAVASPSETVKHGYVGQLYEVTSLAVAASPVTVNEGATRQLGASATLDDATAMTVAAASVTWSVQSGPINSISGGGLATAGAVYQNTSATVRGAFAGHSDIFELLVLNVNDDNFGSYAGDGLEDGWQVSNFGLNNPQAGPANDPDGDGQNNRFEYVAGTIPLDALSKFRLLIETVDGQPSHRDIIFSPRFPSRSYRVEYRPNAAAGAFLPLTGGSISVSDHGVVRTVTDLTATEAERFYRVQINYP